MRNVADRAVVPEIHRKFSESHSRLTAVRGRIMSMDSGQAKVLVVDDEPNITDLVATALRYEGFDVATAGNGRGALDCISGYRPHLVVLDVMLPDLDGFEVARRLRQEGRRVPILFLTARDATEDKVRGLTLGGDDYVTKPFSLEELLARVRAVLRRVSDTKEVSSRLSFSDLELDEETREVFRGSTPIELTPTEFKLLRYLLLNPRRVLSKAQILDHVWEYDFGGDANVVETYISYLRKKIDTLGPPLIHTLRGAGYSLRVPTSV
jgi:two-component system, OmpR family, response regulator